MKHPICRPHWCGLLAALLVALTGLAAEPPPPAILLVGADPQSGVPRRLAADHGLVFGSCALQELTWERLQPFNAVVLFDFSRLNPETTAVNHVEISPAGFERLAALLERYVRAGGGLYVYGVSFTHMGQGWASETLNQFLARIGAQVLFEELRDPPNELRQPDGGKVLYAQADMVADHPATTGVYGYWYAIGPFSYGPWTRPLKLSWDWSPLIFTSPSFTSTPLGNPREAARPIPGAKTAVVGTTAPIYAVGKAGKGRLVLNGGESTISFFGYDFSAYADRHWGRMSMERAPNGKRSYGLELLASSLKWLAEPSRAAGTFGGYQPPPPTPWQPRVAQPIAWPPPTAPTGEYRYWRGVAGVKPAGAGGTGTVTEWVAAARAAGLHWLLVTADFAQTTPAAWQQLVADCATASGADFAAIPAVLTRDHLGNAFVQAGRQSWPRPERLDKDDPTRVYDHLGYWMSDANFPLRAILRAPVGNYPAWLHSGYDTIAFGTTPAAQASGYTLDDLLDNQHQGDRPRVMAFTFLTAPADLATVPEHTWLQAPSPAEQPARLTEGQFSGGALSYVSAGPRIRLWHIANAHRDTYGERYVPGTERWRLSLRAESDVPLREVVLYDHTRLWRRYALTGTTADLTIDGLHDQRHVITAVVTDEQGRQAVVGGIETSDRLFAQYFCSDRCNIMGGVSTLRDAAGRETTVPASTQLYKAGRLQAGTVGQGEYLPGIDGSGGGAQFFLASNLYLTAATPETSEERPEVHRIQRPWEGADGLVFMTPIELRSSAPGHAIYGHNPYVPLALPTVEASLTQFHFYRQPMYPSPCLAEWSLVPPVDTQLKAGWQGFSVRFAGTWGKFTRYTIVRRDGTTESGPAADEATGTRWGGTLRDGDSLYLPEVGEGFYNLGEPTDLVIECIPSKQWFRLYTGRTALESLPAHQPFTSRNLLLRMPDSGDAGLAQWREFGRQFGLLGEPAYTVNLTQGTRVSSQYLLALQATDHAVLATIPQAPLPQRLPVRVQGLNPQWTAAMIDLDRHQWFPLGVWEGAAHTTVDVAAGDHRLFLGHPVVCDQSALQLTLLPANADGPTVVDLHNPTTAPIATTVRVIVDSFLAPRQQHTVTVPPGTTHRLPLTPPPTP